MTSGWTSSLVIISRLCSTAGKFPPRVCASISVLYVHVSRFTCWVNRFKRFKHSKSHEGFHPNRSGSSGDRVSYVKLAEGRKHMKGLEVRKHMKGLKRNVYNRSMKMNLPPSAASVRVKIGPHPPAPPEHTPRSPRCS